MRHILPTNIKTADMISHACRLSYQLYIPSNRIVKPNNRYTRQPASHGFPFYSVPDKVYVLTATNRIAMRFAVRSTPPFSYRTKRTDYFKGGIVSGTAARRFAILRIDPTMPKAEQSAATRRRLDHAFLPAVRRCKTEHLNDGGSNVARPYLEGTPGAYFVSSLIVYLTSLS